ncbi:MAG: hypothetical protein HC913_09790 [Microscillaceae bacterium]|nr:hypothetical protein [Microscillaceae bacterium]
MDKAAHNAMIGVYENHLAAVEALKVLMHHNFPMKHVAIIGPGGGLKEIEGAYTWEDATIRGAEVGGVVGGLLGVLSGLTLFLLPELGIIYAAGPLLYALFGGAGGASAGGLGGSLIGAVLGTKIGPGGKVSGKADPEDEQTYQDYIKAGKFIIVVHGPDTEVAEAHQILIENSNMAYAERHYL